MVCSCECVGLLVVWVVGWLVHPTDGWMIGDYDDFDDDSDKNNKTIHARLSIGAQCVLAIFYVISII